MCFVSGFFDCATYKLASFGQCKKKYHHDAIHSPGSSRRKCQYEDFTVSFNLRIDSYSYWWSPNTQSTPWCLDGVISHGDFMSPVIFPHGPRLNTEAYIKCLEKRVRLWIDRVAAWRLYVCQQGSALFHTNKRTQYWLWENFCDHITPNIWPLNSPDCKPLDYYAWDPVEVQTNKNPRNTKELKARLTAAFTNLNK